MSESVKPSGPPKSLALTVFLLLLFLLGREVCFDREDLPAFLPAEPHGLWLELGRGFPRPGAHQFSDALTVRDVISLTDFGRIDSSLVTLSCREPLVGGERLDMIRSDEKVTEIQCSWMQASHRVSLGIPLHPDRMTTADWMFLPGIGESLAEKIENDRQKNGDFGRFDVLDRVPGIGPKRLLAWKKFFVDSLTI